MGVAPRAMTLNLSGAELLQDGTFDFSKAKTAKFVAPAPGYYLVMVVFSIYWENGPESFTLSVENGKEVLNTGYYRSDYISSNRSCIFETKLCLAKLNKGGSISATSNYWTVSVPVKFYRIK